MNTAMQQMIKELNALKSDFQNDAGSHVSTIANSMIEIALSKAKRLCLQEETDHKNTYEQATKNAKLHPEELELAEYGYFKQNFTHNIYNP